MLLTELTLVHILSVLEWTNSPKGHKCLLEIPSFFLHLYTVTIKPLDMQYLSADPAQCHQYLSPLMFERSVFEKVRDLYNKLALWIRAF